MERKEFIKQLTKLGNYSLMMVDSLNNYHTDSLQLNNYDKTNMQAFLKPCEEILTELVSILNDKTIDKFPKP